MNFFCSALCLIVTMRGVTSSKCIPARVAFVLSEMNDAPHVGTLSCTLFEKFFESAVIVIFTVRVTKKNERMKD